MWQAVQESCTFLVPPPIGKGKGNREISEWEFRIKGGCWVLQNLEKEAPWGYTPVDTPCIQIKLQHSSVSFADAGFS